MITGKVHPTRPIHRSQALLCLAQSVHSRSDDNLTAHPEAADIIRQASGFPRFDEFPGPRLALPAVQLDHPPTASGR